MLLLTSTSDLVQVITGSASSVDVHASWADNSSGTITVGRQNTADITTAATTTIVPSPGASVQRNVKALYITNNHATISTTILVQHTDGTNVKDLMGVTLLAGENLVLNEYGEWYHYDVNGGKYNGNSAASQADMEAAASSTVFVTPANIKWSPHVAKAWLKCGITANILASLNVASLTDTGTGVVTITLTTAFSSANWACIPAVEATATTWAVANTRECHIRSATQTASVVALDCIDNTATTSLVKDPTAWHMAGFGDQ